MKKNFYFLPFVAALALTGCSSDDPEMGIGNDGGGVEGTHYLAINIATTPDGGTRAAEGEQYGNLYEDGTTEENEVKRVRFFFFDNNGSPVTVTNNKSQSYIDWYKNSDTDKGQITDEFGNEGNDHKTGTVEKILKAVVVIETSKTGKLPTQVVAVVNPSAIVLSQQKPSLLQLRNAAFDYAGMANGVVDGKNVDKNFVMSNSVYASSGNVVETQAITASDFKDSQEEARNNPVTIHVERTMAKVRVSLDNSITTTEVTIGGNNVKLLQLTDNAGNAIKVGEGAEAKDVYLNIHGWGVTETLKNAWMLKHISPSWPSNTLFPGVSMAWNDEGNYRSYWADICENQPDQPDGLPGKNVHYNFNDGSKQAQLGGKYYVNENGFRKPESGEDYKPTSVIIYGNLCDKTGTPLMVCELAGLRVIGEDALKASYLQLLDANGDSFYYKDGTSMKQIAAADIKFLTAKEASEAGLISEADFNFGVTIGSYKVYPCLSDDGKAKTWYIGDQELDANKVTAENVNNKLISMGSAKIWNTGDTYYFTEIGHFGTSVGVVRNHIYDITLTGIYGLGTPVYKPDEVIYPEKPSADNKYVAAKLKILSWRVVNKDVKLDWGN